MIIGPYNVTQLKIVGPSVTLFSQFVSLAATDRE